MRRYPPVRQPLWLAPIVLASWSGVLLTLPQQSLGQSLNKLKQQAINRTHLTFVSGDTVQRFTVTYAKPDTRPDRFYYWQGPTQILRTAGAYNGHLLNGPYQLTSRNGNLLGSGEFAEGLKTGLWRTWRPDGTPVTSSYWRKGRQRGKVSYYDEAGQLVKASKPPKPAAAAPGQPAKARFWQPVYWKEKGKRIRLPWRKKAKQQRVPPTFPTTPTGQPGAPQSLRPGS